MAAQKQDDQFERTFSSYVRIQVVVLKTYLGRWTIGRSGERGSGISVVPARYDDDDDDISLNVWRTILSIPFDNILKWAISVYKFIQLVTLNSTSCLVSNSSLHRLHLLLIILFSLFEHSNNNVHNCPYHSLRVLKCKIIHIFLTFYFLQNLTWGLPENNYFPLVQDDYIWSPDTVKRYKYIVISQYNFILM